MKWLISQRDAPTVVPPHYQYNRPYDIMGHVATSAQYLYGGSPYNMTYGYNLAGSQISFTYPSGRVVTTAYDSADRFSTVQDVYNGTSSTHASSINYWPNRTIQTAILGHPNLNGYSIVDSTTLNSRLQVSNRSAQLGSVFPVQLNVSKPKSATTRSAESPSKWNGC